MSPLSIVNALVVATDRTSRMIGPLHALHYHWEMLSAAQRASALKDAREAAEDALRAIETAERSLALSTAVAA